MASKKLLYIIAAFIIILPCMLALRYGKNLEPYPAVMLPAGAGKIQFVDDSTHVFYKTLAGYSGDGQLVRIPVAEFFHPIPVQYVPAILSSNFGFNGTEISHHNVGLIGWLKKKGIIKKRIFPVEAHAFTKSWLKEKLSGLGLQTDSILIIYLEKVVHQGSGFPHLTDTLRTERIKL
jgi:hypothetical protein